MTGDEAERYLLSLELFGMRFGLERMRRLMTALGHPERTFGSVHVVGTNGKSSTTRMIAAILQEHGLRVGAYLSPHLVSFGERIRIQDEDLTPAQFGAAVTRARHAAEKVDRNVDADDRVTQFELLTAAAYDELARRHVQVAVIEAGLGGRYDATNVIPSTVQVLTSVGLEHTRWLGPTIHDIAVEKLDVVQPGATLVLGAGLAPDAAKVARAVAAERGARIVEASADPGAEVRAPGIYQQRNFALARAAAEAYLGELDARAVDRAAAAVRVPGRMQQIATDPLTLVDVAHNPEGAQALAESMGEIGRGRRVVAVVSILDDKDAASMLTALASAQFGADAFVFTRTRNPRALSPATLLSLLGQLHGGGGPPAEIVSDPRSALAHGREVAGPDGVVVATGSSYLIADLVSPPIRRRASML
jgi:dihydrofolate synthase/folylpolyglutamate synthase